MESIEAIGEFAFDDGGGSAQAVTARVLRDAEFAFGSDGSAGLGAVGAGEARILR